MSDYEQTIKPVDGLDKFYSRSCKERADSRMGRKGTCRGRMRGDSGMNSYTGLHSPAVTLFCPSVKQEGLSA
jgi:hypothetical protein